MAFLLHHLVWPPISNKNNPQVTHSWLLIRFLTLLMISGFCNSNPGIYLGFFMLATFCFVFVSALLVNSCTHHRYCADKRFNIKSFESLLSYTFVDSFLLLEGVNESHKSDTQYKGLLIY
ncbi:hypothetical protein VCRA2113O137_130142 [Vibrio crassostreae]|nr:hypothetical protein VCRA2113O137_130142 [Vibrio crassostreae]CAK2866754.1 hypothetical protein VCRA2113O139_20144 [Vibrio crassostreae]